ncbi:type I secretion protein [Ruegeria arenilitoris]|uniref:type I secretion protein n=1 Tax=Ruegeria arenilitoris TaxID=1173585 RepID=UPI0014800DEE|nr:type I secretion protein [Ruegeria arenilitoris]
MSLDSISEQIAHFIGTFELTTEQVRLRDQYEEFVALKRKAELEDLEDPTRIEIKADLKMNPGEYDPLPYKFFAPQEQLTSTPADPGPLKESEVNLGSSPGREFTLPEGFEGSGAAFQLNTIQIVPEFVTELIGSAVTYTFQTIKLNDNDVVGEGDFRDLETLIAQGEAMLATALSLHVISGFSIDVNEYLSGEAVERLIDQINSFVHIEIEGATVVQFYGEDAHGVIVNGEYVDEAPDFNDLLPENLTSEEDEETEHDFSYAMPDEWDQPIDAEFEGGHSVVAGGNLAVNEVSISVGWVDAPNILVGGQSINLGVVSQVAVVTDFDEGEPGVQSTTHVVQSSEILVEGNEAPWLEGNVGEAGEDPFVVVDWISGDLLVTNFIKQIIDATDIDHIHTEITASSTAYTLGENIMTNVTDILQLGSFYDMIIVGGDMLSIDVVTQTIALMDSDVVHGAHPTAPEENLVMNEVSLTTTGEDTHEEMSDSLADVIPMQEVDTDALEDALMNDPMFAGAELVRVLKIEGDLLQVNAIEQVTKLQDDDDIYVDANNGQEVSAIGAGNAILNKANIKKMGVDSVIMAKEEEYSELMLHQASMFESAQEEKAEIVGEAVALMLEEMDAAANSKHMPDHHKLTPSEQATIDDGLQSMLA